MSSAATIQGAEFDQVARYNMCVCARACACITVCSYVCMYVYILVYRYSYIATSTRSNATLAFYAHYTYTAS